MKLREIAERLECRLEGDGEIDIRRVAGIEEAGPGDLTFFTNPKYASALRKTGASGVILAETAEAAPCAMLRVRHPYLAFAKAVELFAATTARPPASTPGRRPSTAVVSPDASVGHLRRSVTASASAHGPSSILR